MEILFSKSEILWQESLFPLSTIFLSVGLLVFAFAAYLFYTYKFRLSFIGSIVSVFITGFVIWSGSGTKSGLNLKMNTFTKTAIIADNLSNSEYKFSFDELASYSKQEYKKSDKNKTVTYHQFFLHLKNGAYFKLKESNDFSVIKTLMNQMQKELDLPVAFNHKEIQKNANEKKEFESIDICDFKFEKIQREKTESTCSLSWKAKMPNYLYPILCIFFLALLIWMDSIFLEGFSKSHFYWLIGISLFIVPFGFLGIQRFNTTIHLKFDKDKITSSIQNSILNKNAEANISYSQIKFIDAQMETMQDSFVISPFSPEPPISISEITDTEKLSHYLSFSVYGLPVVDKLRLCDLIKKSLD